MKRPNDEIPDHEAESPTRESLRKSKENKMSFSNG